MLTSNQKTQVKRLTDKIYKVQSELASKPLRITLEDVFDCCPSGDFNYLAEEVGDWHAYCCGENDCERQWHVTAYATSIKRENGRREITIYSCDEDGDWNFCYSWEEGEDFQDIGEVMQSELDGYFIGWALYWLDCAITGEEPLGEYIGEGIPSYKFCIDAAKDSLKYAAMRLKR